MAKRKVVKHSGKYIWCISKHMETIDGLVVKNI